ncbi:DUF1801 domain-containing protein [Luteibaculum oceani]|uniref:DUF1801 domain-containing protein n=1 Tax=Luteibaculum oceani TaxID=1294296 RepID=A0A5C6UZ55_9FLAO|nr:DUF1801 domain-containing protein [Luteibaculum oceani]TXC76258.1 DUF1801 domain-containing protein [Luteibaculum oceani]
MPLVTQKTDLTVADFFAKKISNQRIKEDCETLLTLKQEVSACKPLVWGNYFIIGFGSYTYQRKGQKENLEWFHMGFAPRSNKITLYLGFDITTRLDLLEKLGKHKCGKGCLYINKLADIEITVLKELLLLSKTARWH